VQHHRFRHRQHRQQDPDQIIPPAIPKMPERNDVPTMVRHKARSEAGSWRDAPPLE
jgi:hypothetical protein